MILSGPTVAHEPFWQQVRKFIEIEEPTPVNRVLGRNHKTVEDEHGKRMLFDMSDFAKNACASYEDLSGCTLKSANTPFLPDGSLVTSDFEERGSMATDASKILMKILWSARLSRPDLMKGISDLTRKITTWSKADDRKLFRLMCYLKGTTNHVLEGYIRDKPEALKLNLYTDADHASGVEDVKSTSGMFLTLEGPNSFWPLCWGSKRQGATARSTCEAEIISLDSGLFGEGIPMQCLFETILNRPIHLVCQQDNASVIQIVHGGYSAKLRHLKKVHKLNLSALYEAFDFPDVFLQYVKSASQRADPFTKALEPCKWPAALDLLHIRPPWYFPEARILLSSSSKREGGEEKYQVNTPVCVTNIPSSCMPTCDAVVLAFRLQQMEEFNSCWRTNTSKKLFGEFTVCTWTVTFTYVIQSSQFFGCNMHLTDFGSRRSKKVCSCRCFARWCGCDQSFSF